MALSVGMGFALGRMPMSMIFGATYNAVIFSSMLMLAFNETLGYNVIVKLIFHWVDKIVYGGKVPDAIAPAVDKIAEKVKEVVPVSVTTTTGEIGTTTCES